MVFDVEDDAALAEAEYAADHPEEPADADVTQDGPADRAVVGQEKE